jgi:hypothetical protein
MVVYRSGMVAIPQHPVSLDSKDVSLGFTSSGSDARAEKFFGK